MTSLLALGVLAGCASLPRRAAPTPPYQPPAEGPIVPGVEAATPDLVPVPTDAVAGVPAATEPTLRPLLTGDRLGLTLRMYPKIETFEAVIDESGNINLDLVGRVRVSGMSSAEAEKAIEKAYMDAQFYKTITASIIPPTREFFVKGYVLKPGNYPIVRGKVTVLQALSMAGGWNEFADPNKVRLIRGEETMILSIPKIQSRVEPDVNIEPGDVIDVPKRWM
ncbi:MAG: polysaccharide biosynthesis/export family protein [Kiritimatiellia bacterium]